MATKKRTRPAPRKASKKRVASTSKRSSPLKQEATKGLYGWITHTELAPGGVPIGFSGP